MGESTATFLFLAITGLSGTVTSLAIYIWKAEVDRRKAAEAKLAEYEQPAREATAELLRLASDKRRQDAHLGYGSTETTPWPWSETELPPNRPGPRRLR